MGALPARSFEGRASGRASAVDGYHCLPHPVHLFTCLSRGDHYHFGLFAGEHESLCTAQDRLTLRCARFLPPGARVLDVGCGPGGSSRVLTRRGYVTVGVDPSAPNISFARRSVHEDHAQRFTRMSYREATDSAPRRGQPFGGLLLLEVLQHLTDLEEVLERARKVLAPGGVLVVADVFKVPALPWSSVPFHPRGRIMELAGSSWQLLAREILTARVMPTTVRILSGLEQHRSKLVDVFSRSHPDIVSEIEELAGQCRHLTTAFRNGDLVYELVALRRPIRA